MFISLPYYVINIIVNNISLLYIRNMMTTSHHMNNYFNNFNWTDYFMIHCRLNSIKELCKVCHFDKRFMQWQGCYLINMISERQFSQWLQFYDDICKLERIYSLSLDPNYIPKIYNISTCMHSEYFDNNEYNIYRLQMFYKSPNDSTGISFYDNNIFVS